MWSILSRKDFLGLTDLEIEQVLSFIQQNILVRESKLCKCSLTYSVLTDEIEIYEDGIEETEDTYINNFECILCDENYQFKSIDEVIEHIKSMHEEELQGYDNYE